MTIKDIAKEANVSVATVSRVINNYKWVSPDLRERVLKIIERESYHPSYNASAMATGKSRVVAIIVPDIAGTFFAEFTSVAAKILKEAGYATVLVQTNNDEAEEESFFNGSFLGMADGIISGKYGQTQLDPHGTATRAECAVMLERYCRKYHLYVNQNIYP